MHGEPDFQAEADLVRQNWHKLLVPRGDLMLAAGDADAGSERRKLSGVAVGPEPERVPGEAQPRVANGGERGAVAIETDQAMVSEVRNTLRQPPSLDVRAMGEEADTHAADFPCDERSLSRSPGSHGDIRIAPKEILYPIAHRQLDRDGRVSRAKARKNGWQHLAPHDLTRCHPHAPANNARFAGCRAPEGGLRSRHCIGMRNELERGTRRQ